MAYELGLQRLIEYQRLVVDAALTEEGPFLESELPDDISSSYVAIVEVVYAVVHIDFSGRVRLTTYNPPDLQNESRETGLPIVLDGLEIRKGSGSPNIEVSWRKNDNINPEYVDMFGYVWSAFENELGEWWL